MNRNENVLNLAVQLEKRKYRPCPIYTLARNILQKALSESYKLDRVFRKDLRHADGTPPTSFLIDLYLIPFHLVDHILAEKWALFSKLIAHPLFKKRELIMNQVLKYKNLLQIFKDCVLLSHFFALHLILSVQLDRTGLGWRFKGIIKRLREVPVEQGSDVRTRFLYSVEEIKPFSRRLVELFVHVGHLDHKTVIGVVFCSWLDLGIQEAKLVALVMASVKFLLLKVNQDSWSEPLFGSVSSLEHHQYKDREEDNLCDRGYFLH
jgi:hypothetical protein